MSETPELTQRACETSDLTTQLNALCARFVGPAQRSYVVQPAESREHRIRKLRVMAQNVLFQQIRGPHFVRYVCRLNIVVRSPGCRLLWVTG